MTRVALPELIPGILMLSCLSVTVSAADKLYRFDVPKQAAGAALNAFAQQAEQQVLFPFSRVKSITSNTLKGEYTVSEGIEILLKGTGLKSVFSKDNVITIKNDVNNKIALEGKTQMKKENKMSLLSKVALLLFGATNIQGVVAQDADANNETETLEEVVVTGARGSIINALNRKKGSANVIDSIEAEDLGKFPDINLAESLQRVPGITLERSVTGSGRTLTVRGLSSQFTRVEN